MKKTKVLKYAAVYFVIVLAFVGFSYYQRMQVVKNTPVETPTPTIAPTSTPTVKPKPKILDGGKLFNLVNAYRVKNGLKQLSWFHPLCEYSKNRSNEVKTDWSHDQLENDAKSGLLWQYCPDCLRAGENLAKDYFSEEAVLQGWINSPSHNQNLLGDWDIACSYFYGNNYVSIEFGKLK